MHEELIPITMFAVIGIVLGLFYYFRYRTRAEMQKTMRAALERGQDLTPELVDRMAEPRKSAMQDLRRGSIAIAIGVAIALFGPVLGEQDAIRPLLATATLPFAIGIAYLILWRIDRRKDGT